MKVTNGQAVAPVPPILRQNGRSSSSCVERILRRPGTETAQATLPQESTAEHGPAPPDGLRPARDIGPWPDEKGPDDHGCGRGFLLTRPQPERVSRLEARRAVTATVTKEAPMTERNPVEDLLRDHVEDLCAADAADIAVALQAAWHGLDVLQAAGRLLAASHVDYAVLQRHAQPILIRALEILQTAPSLPADLKSIALNLTDEPGPLGDRGAYVIHRSLLDVAYGLTILLPAVAGNARARADRKACRETTRQAHHLVNCYEGRLNLFLSPRET